MRSNFSGKNQSKLIALLVSQDCLTNCPFGILQSLTRMGRFSPSQGTLKNSSRSIYFTTKSFRYPLALSKRASLTLKFWMLWNEVCLYQAQSITGDLQTLEDTLTFFGQSFLFTMKLIFCRISFGQMRRQIIDLVVGKRIDTLEMEAVGNC
ncbi:hypothetical protein Tsp_07156 [Trichinella spiralis]|uniref:hypothetical protein n=1 Tax=Trichinella spiralis TaxID=6334 RepID=UPI0001EFBD55|nr:hypothetical protein Tsp_07156 [Trichinella spiralis]